MVEAKVEEIDDDDDDDDAGIGFGTLLVETICLESKRESDVLASK
jgi:hypothetical protein